MLLERLQQPQPRSRGNDNFEGTVTLWANDSEPYIIQRLCVCVCKYIYIYKYIYMFMYVCVVAKYMTHT